MRNLPGLPPGSILGYCTNVHAGDSLQAIKANLERYALNVKGHVSPDQPMGVGLWFSAKVIDEIIRVNEVSDAAADFGEWLRDHGLLPFTLNGFPFSNFHQAVVKHAVYQPDWSDPRRLLYTQKLAVLLDYLLPEGEEGSISTLPLGWGGAVGEGWSDNLLEMVAFLADLEESTGRLIHLNIEPEPGCEIGDIQTLFTLLITLEAMSGFPRELLRRHLRVCHDICHSAVMFESPDKMLEWCRSSGYHIGKVQLSSALRIPFAGRSAPDKAAMRDQLERFAEPRYLHQTTIGTRDGHALKAIYDDLPDALRDRKSSGYEWRVHFHLPVHLQSIGQLSTTQQAITHFLAALKPEDEIRHWEVETYAWNVLPKELQVPDLVEGIATELLWVKEQARPIHEEADDGGQAANPA